MNGIVNPQSNLGSGNVAQQTDSVFDLFFKIQEKVNARSEELSKSYNENLLVKFSDIKELHFKTLQSISSLKPANNVVGLRIAISHHEGESEKFNTFDDFERHNVTSPNPTSDIVLTYSFTLYDAECQNFEKYKVINQIRSRVAELKQLEREAPPFVSKAILASLVTTTAIITIHYEDYVKARHFTAMFDEWVRGCDEAKAIKFINYLKPHSHLITRFGKFLIYALLAYFTSSAIDLKVIGADLTTKFIVVYASVFVIIGGVSETLLRKVEMSIDGYLPLSYIEINKGDTKLISDYGGRNQSSIVWSVIALIGTLAIGMLTNSTYDIIKWLILK